MKSKNETMVYFTEYKGKPIKTFVCGTFHKGSAGGYWDPPESPEVDDLEVLYDGENIVNEFSEDEIEDIIDAYIRHRVECIQCEQTENDNDEEDRTLTGFRL